MAAFSFHIRSSQQRAADLALEDAEWRRYCAQCAVDDFVDAVKELRKHDLNLTNEGIDYLDDALCGLINAVSNRRAEIKKLLDDAGIVDDLVAPIDGSQALAEVRS